MCGGVNSSVSKYTRAVVAAEASGEGKKSTMVVIGEKGKAQLARGASAANIVATVADYGKVRVTFSQVSAIAGLILAKEYDVCRLVYNRFISAISYKATVATVLSPDTLEKAAEAGGALDAYEVEGPDRAELLQSMAEFQLGGALFDLVSGERRKTNVCARACPNPCSLSSLSFPPPPPISHDLQCLFRELCVRAERPDGRHGELGELRERGRETNLDINPLHLFSPLSPVTVQKRQRPDR